MSSTDFLSGALNILTSLCGSLCTHATYIGDLKDNLQILKDERDTLTDLRDNVKTKIDQTKKPQTRVQNRVTKWLEKVEAVEKEVYPILQKGEQEVANKCLGSCCPNNCWASYKIGKKVLKMIPRVTKLTEDGKFDEVVDKLPPAEVDDMLMKSLTSLNSAMVELKSSRNEAIECLRRVEEVEHNLDQVLQNLSFPSDNVRQNWPFLSYNVMLRYACSFTHPGTPSIFYHHFDDRGLIAQIRKLAEIRDKNRIDSSSTVEILASEKDMYMAKIDGKIIVKIGPRFELEHLNPSPEEFDVAAHGDQYCVWEKKKSTN